MDGKLGGLTLEQLLVARHEAAHVAAAWILWGDSVGEVTRDPDRVPDGALGVTRPVIPEHLMGRAPGLSAAEAAVVCLAPIWSVPESNGDGDVRVANAIAEHAYTYRPSGPVPDDVQGWLDDWLHAATVRTRELVKSARFGRLQRAVAKALESQRTLDAADVSRVLREADRA